MKLIGCIHLDYDEEKYSGCTLRDCASKGLPEVKYFERPSTYEGCPTNVQFCGKGKGRINSILDCYKEGALPCYEKPNQDQNHEMQPNGMAT